MDQVVPDTLYSICNVLYGKFMNALSPKNGITKVVADDSRDGNGQVFIAKKSGEGYMYMESMLSTGNVINIHTDELTKT